MKELEIKITAVEKGKEIEVNLTVEGTKSKWMIMLMLMEVVPTLLGEDKLLLGALGMFFASGKNLGELGLADVTKIDLSKISGERKK